MNPFIYLIIHVVSAFFATFFFSILFNVPKKHLIVCGVVGALGWGLYKTGILFGYSEVISNFVGAFAVAELSYFLAKRRRAPVTVFLISGVIPLVPGVGLYRTMYHLLFADYARAIDTALLTFQISGVIAGAIILASLLPLLFRNKRQKI